MAGHGPTQALLLTAVIMLAVVPLTPGLKIGSFNAMRLGQRKMENEAVVNILVDIIQRYDIILLQEVRDKSGKVMEDLLERVNDGDHLFEVEVSERLGRTHSKEQLAFFYRVDHDIAVADTMHWDDGRDLFERDPFAVRFEVPHCDVPEFVFVAVHVDPEDAEHEIGALADVRDDLQKVWFADNLLFMGDLSADCLHFPDAAKDRSPLTTDDFFWWIKDGQDTTVAQTGCAYDRFVMVGDEFIDAVVCEAVGVFRFDEEFNITNKEALLVSDHYPIELELEECRGPFNDNDEINDEL